MQRPALVMVSVLTFAACAMEIDPQVTRIERAPVPPTPGRAPRPDPPPEPVPPCPSETVLTPDDLDQEVGWKPAKANPGACSAADIATLEANFENTNIKTYFDSGVGLPGGCFDCVFAKDTDANWGPIVGTAENNGETGFVNVGACAGVIGGEPCGKARQYEVFCLNAACNECTATQTARDACVAKARTGDGMCTEFAGEVLRACADAGAGCGTPIDDARTLCGPTDVDAGM